MKKCKLALIILLTIFVAQPAMANGKLTPPKAASAKTIVAETQEMNGLMAWFYSWF